MPVKPTNRSYADILKIVAQVRGPYTHNVVATAPFHTAVFDPVQVAWAMDGYYNSSHYGRSVQFYLRPSNATISPGVNAKTDHSEDGGPLEGKVTVKGTSSVLFARAALIYLAELLFDRLQMVVEFGSLHVDNMMATLYFPFCFDLNLFARTIPLVEYNKKSISSARLVVPLADPAAPKMTICVWQTGSVVITGHRSLLFLYKFVASIVEVLADFQTTMPATNHNDPNPARLNEPPEDFEFPGVEWQCRS